MHNTPTEKLPKLSVIIVVRNGEKTIARALDSIVTQHYPNVELIVFDALSEDKTLDVIKSYGDIVSILRSEADSGPPDAYNKGVAAATGDYIGFLNADDEFEPGLLWAIADGVRRKPDTEVVTFGMLYKLKNNDSHTVVTGYYADKRQLALTLDYVLIENQTFMLSRFFHRNLLAEVGPFNTDRSLWYYSNDREYMTRLALRGCKNFIIPKALYGFHLEETSLSNNPDNYGRIIEEHLLIAETLLKREDLSHYQRITIEKWRKRQLIFGFWKVLFRMKWQEAKTFLLRGKSYGGWKFYFLCLNVLAEKVVKNIGLKLSNSIDRGAFL